MTRVFRVMMCATVLTVLMTGAASAQATGSIFGKVTDASGGVLPGVTVTVSGPALQQPLVVTTWGQSGLMAGATVEGAKITEITP